LRGSPGADYQSGEFEGDDRPLTKTGNEYLRYYFIEAANSVRHHCPEFGSHYAKKFAEATRHHHRRALELTARKLVRLVDSMLRAAGSTSLRALRSARSSLRARELLSPRVVTRVA